MWFRLCSLKKTVLVHSMTAFVFLFSNFLPHKPIPRNTFMGKTFEFTLGDSWVRPKSTFSKTKGNNEYPLHIYMGEPLPPAPGMPGL